MLKLFTARFTVGLAAEIALAEASAECEIVRLDVRGGEQTRTPYLAINPKGRVPALVTAQGVLTETPAILAYIAQIFPAARLAPLDDPFAFARAQEFNSYLCSTVHVAHAHRMRGKRWADDPAAIAEMQRKVPETVFAAFSLIEQGLLPGPWVLGADYSICDCYLFALSRWLEGDGIDPARLPRVAEHMRIMEERPAVRQVLAGA
jgi:glutathione S-transferase